MARPLLTAEGGGNPYRTLTTIVSLAGYTPGYRYSVKNIPPDGFFDIQILQNSISAGPPPWTPLGELTTLPQAL